jgi:hypothetical protein
MIVVSEFESVVFRRANESHGGVFLGERFSAMGTTQHPSEALHYKQKPRLTEADLEIKALRDENKQLRELVVQLSKIILKNVVDQK